MRILKEHLVSGNSYAPQAAIEVGPCSRSPTLKHGPLYHGHFWSRWGGQEETGSGWGRRQQTAMPPAEPLRRVCEAKEPIWAPRLKHPSRDTPCSFTFYFRTSYTPIILFTSRDSNKLNLKLLVTFYFLSEFMEKKDKTESAGTG